MQRQARAEVAIPQASELMRLLTAAVSGNSRGVVSFNLVGLRPASLDNSPPLLIVIDANRTS